MVFPGKTFHADLSMEVFIADFFVALYIKGFCAGIRAPIPAVLRFRDIDQFPGGIFLDFL